MAWDWSQLGGWFVTSASGAFLIKLMDLGFSRYKQRHSRTEEKVNKLKQYVDDHARLTQFYRFHARLSGKVVSRIENGKRITDVVGKVVTMHEVLEPDPRFEEAIKRLENDSIEALIANHIAMIRLNAGEMGDLVHELDPSGELTKRFEDLYIKTIYEVELILKYKDSGDPHELLQQLLDMFREANTARIELREKLNDYIK